MRRLVFVALGAFFLVAALLLLVLLTSDADELEDVLRNLECRPQLP